MFKTTKILNYIAIAGDILFFLIFFSMGFFVIFNDNNLSNLFPEYQIPPNVYSLLGFIMLFISFIFVIMIGVSIIYNQKLNKAQSPKDLLGWSVVMIIFGYVIVGVLGLLLTEEDLKDKDGTCKKENTDKTNVVTTSTTNKCDNTIEEKLEKIKSLYDNGLITKDEYDQKRKDILRNF